ncbi:MAG TPA: alpha amylase C-terminal domain-containing protein, partial [Methylomirabilota bacterium]|nr:alpha amylase C-terminal domain-containing protein [Methylomirabilota bacterium]
MSGDDWQRAANLRGLYAFMHGHRGKKLLFMGGEFGQTQEWYHERSLDWHLLETGPYHRGLRALVRELNRLYRNERALHEVEFEPAGFQWIDCDDAQQSVVSFVRRARDPRDFVLFVCNFTAVPMLLGGDETGRTQHGNNNGWHSRSTRSQLEFTRRPIHLRLRHPVFHRPR